MDHLHLLPSSALEQDTLSDSDWLDIASSRESDDNDSLASDHDELPSVPHSRRSSMSLGSSREGDVDAWEGFVVDSGDESSLRVELGMYSVPPTLSSPQFDRLDSSPAIDDNQDTVEDERIREGLEQSLISTLSASRSSSAAYSASTQGSLHDLRLSFPDPLTSSKDNLDLPRPSTLSLDELTTEITSVIIPVEPSDATASNLSEPEQLELPGALVTTPEIVQSGKRDADIAIVFRTLSDHLSSVPAITFFALVSIVMSFAVNTIFRPPEPTPTSANKVQTVNSVWGVTNTELNNSITPYCSGSNALMASSLKDFALAVIHPSSTSLSVTSQFYVTSQPSCSKAMSRSGSQSPAQPARTTATTDFVLRSAPATLTPSVQVIRPITDRKGCEVPPSSVLSIRMANSFSEVFETFNAAIDAVQNDLKELTDAMDDLIRAIQAQTKKAMEKSVDAAYIIRDEVVYRNERARDKARELKEKSGQFIQAAGEQIMETTWSMRKRGENFMTFAHEHIKGRTLLAKEKARKKMLLRTDVWRAYVESHDEWIKVLLDKDMARREYKKWMKARRERRKRL